MAVELPRDFKESLASLSSHGVEYLLIGGYAVGYYGYPRATNDLDVWVGISHDNACRLIAALAAFGFSSTSLSPDLFLEAGRIVRFGMPPMRIEVLTGISGVDFADSYRERVDVVLDGVDVPVISLPHLLDNKRAVGRPKDMLDVGELTRRRSRRPRSGG